ncbi:MAG: PRC-barrel domain-containing protein, partial [Acidobacteria bacterium]|nr:PRC-barrel domain-containing protein [Acidobacteriota bacterium]
MLYTFSSLRGLRIRAKDGDIGSVEDLYFDDAEWRVRYLVVDTGTLLIGREVLISPESFLKPDFDEREFAINLSREQIRNSPDVNSTPTVSREEEKALAEHYGWPAYWLPAALIPGTAMEPPETISEPYTPDETRGDAGTHLRSAREMIGYHIEATDSRIGRVSNFVVDDEGWIFRYMVVGIHQVLPGKKVLIAPQWIERIRWLERVVEVQLTKDRIRHSPALDLTVPITREYEQELHDHYERPGYWHR